MRLKNSSNLDVARRAKCTNELERERGGERRKQTELSCPESQMAINSVNSAGVVWATKCNFCGHINVAVLWCCHFFAIALWPHVKKLSDYFHSLTCSQWKYLKSVMNDHLLDASHIYTWTRSTRILREKSGICCSIAEACVCRFSQNIHRFDTKWKWDALIWIQTKKAKEKSCLAVVSIQFRIFNYVWIS